MNSSHAWTQAFNRVELRSKHSSLNWLATNRFYRLKSRLSGFAWTVLFKPWRGVPPDLENKTVFQKCHQRIKYGSAKQDDFLIAQELATRNTVQISKADVKQVGRTTEQWSSSSKIGLPSCFQLNSTDVRSGYCRTDKRLWTTRQSIASLRTLYTTFYRELLHQISCTCDSKCE